MNKIDRRVKFVKLNKDWILSKTKKRLKNLDSVFFLNIMKVKVLLKSMSTSIFYSHVSKVRLNRLKLYFKMS